MLNGGREREGVRDGGGREGGKRQGRGREGGMEGYAGPTIFLSSKTRELNR